MIIIKNNIISDITVKMFCVQKFLFKVINKLEYPSDNPYKRFLLDETFDLKLMPACED